MQTLKKKSLVDTKPTITIEIDDKELFVDALAGDYLKAYGELQEAEHKLETFRYQLLHRALDGNLPDSSGGNDHSYSSAFHKVGDMWDCPTSPIGTCVYDSYTDRAWDDCLFCHDPYERK